MKRVYKFNPLIRYTTIVLALFALSYAIYVVLYKFTDSSTYFQKLLPYAIVFLSLNSLIKNFFTINTITVYENTVVFSKLLSKKVSIEILSIKKIEFAKGRSRFIRIIYQKDGEDSLYQFNSGFPRIFEVIGKFVEKNPKIILDEVLRAGVKIKS